MSLFGLAKTKEALFAGISKLFGGKSVVDSETLDALEEALISADVGVETSVRLVEAVEARVAKDKYVGEEDLKELIRNELTDQFAQWAAIKPVDIPSGQPMVILVVGVNGVGKTTTVGKLAKKFRSEGHSVVLGAADTFRAAAVDQLRIWADRSGATFVEKGMNTDPAAVAYAAVEAGVRNGGGVVLIDTAGRLHNKVNGVGKTTTVGKLAKKFRREGHSVVLGAADTFRAAAVDQLRIWADRSGATFVEKGMNTDPAAVAYAAVEAGVRNGGGVVLIDTAGRLHNKVNLMNELGKIRRVMEKVVVGAPHETWLVLDASTGQNAVNQAVEFSKVTPLTGLILTKMDGTARGGVVLAIAEKLRVPLRYIGVGEGVDDLQEFNAKNFLNALLG